MFAIVLLAAFTSTRGENIYNQDCYATDANPYLRFASKTAYDLIYERPRTNNHEEVRDCEPVQLWIMARHGTRFPGRSTIRAMHQLDSIRSTIVQNHEDRKTGRLCWADLDRLKSWTLNVSMTDAKMLTPQGKSDIYFLAKRFKNRFPTLFRQEYSQNLYTFRHTNSERTRQSANAFAEALFGISSNVWIPPPFENDTIIKPYSNCSRWRHQVRENYRYMREPELFLHGLEMTNLVHNVSQRLGFSYDLASDTAQLLYDMCRYDKAWLLHERSPWCAAFYRDELKVLEYLDDLKSFYEAGYGHHYNLKLGCTPIKDLIERFTLLEEENLQVGYQPLGVFYFTHSDMIAMTLARLGIASHGAPMRHDNFAEQKKREWSSSELTPFAANLAAVFLKCQTGEYNRVMFYHNEKLVHFPGCDVGLCSWKYIREKFKDIPQSCDLEWCNGASSLINGLTFITVVAVSFLLSDFS